MTAPTTCEHASQMGRTKWPEWDWSFFFLPRPGTLTLAKLNQRQFQLLQVQSQLFANGSDWVFSLSDTAQKKKNGPKLIPRRSVCKCGQLAGSQPWRRLFSGKRPKISNHTVFNHHFIYISSLPKVKRGTRRSTSRSEPPQIPLRNSSSSYFFPPSLSHARAPPDWQSHFNLFTPVEPLPLPRSPTCASSGERLSRQLIHQII